MPSNSPETRCRCTWADSNALMKDYHDNEWGRPVHDSRALWEKLMLDGFQAGLSWNTILQKRAAFKLAFDDFQPEIIANYTDADIERLMSNAGIVRSRAKIQATIGGAKAYLAMQEAGEDFAPFIWKMAGQAPILNGGDPPLTQSVLSQEISAALKKRGFKFVGPVIVYAWMQATGIVNDHARDCFLYRHP